MPNEATGDRAESSAVRTKDELASSAELHRSKPRPPNQAKCPKNQPNSQGNTKVHHVIQSLNLPSCCQQAGFESLNP